jgi:type II secretory pathway component PulJ
MIISIEVIIIAILFFVAFVSFAAMIRARLRNTKLTATISQLIVDKQTLGDELDRLSFISSNSVDIENGFIKFLSETRDSAYEYIQDVQISISELKDAIDSGNEENIAVAYTKLIDFLPSSSTGMID